MSLTQILDLPEVATEFSRYVRVPSQTSVVPKLKIPPTGHSSYALVGTAFDYCMRFYIAASNPGLVADQSWVAELALEVIEEEQDCLPKGLSLEQATKGVARARSRLLEWAGNRKRQISSRAASGRDGRLYEPGARYQSRNDHSEAEGFTQPKFRRGLQPGRRS